MRLKTKFAAYIIGSVILGAGVLSVYLVRHRERVEFLALEEISLKFSREVFDLNFLTYDYLTAPSARSRTQWLQQHEKLSVFLIDERQRLSFAGPILEKTSFHLETLRKNFLKLDALTGEGKESGRQIRTDLRAQSVAQLLISTRALFGNSSRLTYVIHERTLENHRQEDLYLIGIFVIGAILFYAMIFSLGRSIFPQLKNLAEGFGEIAHGNLDCRLAVSGNDEMGSLLDSFNKTVAELAETTVSRVNLEKEIKARIESQEKAAVLEEAMAKSPDPVFMLDGIDLSIFYANKGAGDVLGCRGEDLIGKHLEDIVPEINEVSIRGIFADGSGATAWQKFEADFIRNDGTAIPMEMNFQHVLGRVGGVRGHYILIAKDVSEQRDLETERQIRQQELENKIRERTGELSRRVQESEQLNRAMINLLEDLQSTNRQLEAMTRQLIETNKELESFSYSVSHDLRAPLRHMSGFVSLLEKHAEDSIDDQSRHYIDIISRSSAKMGVLIDDLLHYSRTGRTEIRLKEVNSNLLLQEVIDELGPSMKDRRIEWEIEELPPLHADRSLMKIVWTNLLENALKFTSGRDKARIMVGSWSEAGGDTVYFVRDNGVGFNMKYRDKLFGVFQRLHRDSEFPGTGIGLATVQRIIHRHYGRVWAEGTVDQGATVFFSLPGQDSLAEPGSTPQEDQEVDGSGSTA